MVVDACGDLFEDGPYFGGGEVVGEAGEGAHDVAFVVDDEHEDAGYVLDGGGVAVAPLEVGGFAGFDGLCERVEEVGDGFGGGLAVVGGGVVDCAEGGAHCRPA